MKKIKHTARMFQQKHKIGYRTSLMILQEVAMANEWELRTYVKSEALIENHNLIEYANIYKAFTYSYKNEIVILYDGNLNYEEKIKVICHEFGHIVLGHTQTDGIIGKSDDEAKKSRFETEAEIFAKELIKSRFSHKIYRGAAIASVVLITLIAFYQLFLQQNETLNKANVNSSVSFYESAIENDSVFYVTLSGKRYHKEDCRYVKYSTNISTISEEEAALLGYSPCLVCKPDIKT